MHSCCSALILIALLFSEGVALSIPRRRALPAVARGGGHLSPAPPPAFAAERALLASQLLSSWGDRCWEFAAPFFLLGLRPDSLAPVAASGLVAGAATVFAAPRLGRIVDTAPRLRAARASLVAQNALVAGCALLAAFALPGGGGATGVPAAAAATSAPAAAAAVVFSLGSACAGCASLTNSLSVGKDWVVALAAAAPAAAGGGAPGVAAADARERLADVNAALRKIDLAAKVGRVMSSLTESQFESSVGAHARKIGQKPAEERRNHSEGRRNHSRGGFDLATVLESETRREANHCTHTEPLSSPSRRSEPDEREK